MTQTHGSSPASSTPSPASSISSSSMPARLVLCVLALGVCTLPSLSLDSLSSSSTASLSHTVPSGRVLMSVEASSTLANMAWGVLWVLARFLVLVAFGGWLLREANDAGDVVDSAVRHVYRYDEKWGVREEFTWTFWWTPFSFPLCSLYILLGLLQAFAAPATSLTFRFSHKQLEDVSGIARALSVARLAVQCLRHLVVASCGPTVAGLLVTGSPAAVAAKAVAKSQVLIRWRLQ